MNTHGLPNDIMSNLDPFALIILIPLFDLVIYPALRKAGIRFTPIKRITAGFLTGSMAMIWAAVIQAYLYKHSDCGSHAAECKTTVNINVWAQTGSYILIAISEIFASITGLEYAFTKAPRNMRSLVMSCFLVMIAIAAAIGEAFITVSEDPLLVW
jgi:POT family proton-dependent oligopeptide transporter